MRKNNFKIVNDVSYKQCNQCKEWKVANTAYFYQNNKLKGGLNGKCKDCCKAYNDDYKENKKREEFKKFENIEYSGPKKHIVLFSGGLGSYFTTKRLIENGIPKEDIILLFTDTKVEDEDLYRFLDDAEKKLEIPITRFSDGRDIWQVFKDVRYLGNSRRDPCSRVLKRELSREFVKQFGPKNCIIYLGFDWTEIHRLEKAIEAWKPYQIDAPLCNAPYIDKNDMKRMIEEDGIRLPRLYELQFQHNNCGGGCVKAGIGHFAHLLDVFPERFALWEQKEQEIREYLGKDVSILRRTRDGVRTNFTLKQLREERESLNNAELCDIGGCGCFQK